MPSSLTNPPDTHNMQWSSDRSRFGYRMLQKMGWCEGKGLGANEDGTTEHIRVQKKLSMSGVGSRGTNAVWEVPAQVAAGLNAVLAGLQTAGAEKQRTTCKDERTVERKRGFYGRRRAGKCVGNYSREALREIFGGKEFEGKRKGGDDDFGSKEMGLERLGRNEGEGEGEGEETGDVGREQRRGRKREKREKREEKERRKGKLKAGKRIKKSTGKKAKRGGKVAPSDR